MAKRVGVILSGCGHLDGTDPAEALLTLLMLDRAGAEAVCAAPDGDQRAVVDHVTGLDVPGVTRNARVEAARLVPAVAAIRPLAELDVRDIDALIVPGGQGAVTLLSDYAEKGQLCQVQPDVTRLLRALLPARRPMGFFGLSALLAARVLGPVAGVRLTFGSKATVAAKHAAIMGADIRPATVEDLVVDQKAGVFSTPGFLAEGARLAQVARGVDKLVRGLLTVTRDRAPRAAAPDALPVEPSGRARGSA
jgi:enhancing lycopene biosynthesis protein 2